MKRLISLITVLSIAVIMCSCSVMDLLPDGLITKKIIEPEEKVPYLTVVPDELTYSEGYEPFSPLHSRDALPTDGEQTLYKALLEICYDISAQADSESGLYPMPQVRVKAPMTEAQVRTVIKAIYDDNPEIFWISGTVGFYSDESETIVQTYSRYSPEEIDSRLTELHAAADEFYASVPDGLPEYDRELLTHDYICDHVEYDKEVDVDNSESNDPDIYTVYGALVNKKAVCEGYARAFQLLLNGIGVDCVGVSGTADGELHMWNAVGYGGEWYSVDVTWDDCEQPYYRYCFYNLTDEQMSEDHTPSPMFTELSDDEINGLSGLISCDVMNMFIPSCGDPTMGYYYRTAPVLSDFEGQRIESTLLAAAKDKDEIYVFYIDDDLDFDETVDLLFKSYPQYFFGYIADVNNNLEDFSIDSSHVGFYPIERNRIIAVELYYY